MVADHCLKICYDSLNHHPTTKHLILEHHFKSQRQTALVSANTASEKKHELTSYYIINHNKIEMNESNQNQIIKRRPTRRLDTPEALTLVLGWYQNHKRHPPVTWMGWTRWKLNAMYKK